MKLNRIVVLALAAIILAVVASGTASAQYTYSGGLETQDFGDHVTKPGDLSGSPSIHYYDTLGWNNIWDNRWSCSSTGYVTQYQSELRNYPSGGYSVPAGGSVSAALYGSLGGNAGTYTISAKHVYQGNAPARASANSNSMSFTELSW